MGSHESNLVPANALSLRSMQKAESRPGFPNLHPRWARVGFPQFIAKSSKVFRHITSPCFENSRPVPMRVWSEGPLPWELLEAIHKVHGISGYPKFIRVLEVSTILLRFGKLQHFLLEDRLP